VDTNSRVLQFASYAFDAAVLELITSLVMGACICIPSDTQRHDIPKSVATFQANWAFFTPAVARVLNPSDFKTMRTLALGGEAVSAKELNAWRNHVNLFIVYGPTECTIIMCAQLVTKEITEGRNLGHCFGGSGWIVNSDHPNQLLPVGAIGELLIEGPIVAMGYLNDPKKTAGAFIEPPSWLIESRGKSTGHIYKTGDLVRYTDNGIIQYLGRKDLQVKLRGNRIELGEVESHLRASFPDIRDAVAEVVKPEGNDRQPILMAFVCGNDCASQVDEATIPDITPEALFGKPSLESSMQAQLAEAAMGKSLPVYMIPTVYLPLRYRPLTRTGKLDRKKIRATAALLSPQQLDEYDSSTNATGLPTTREEIFLQRAWAHVLNKDVASIGLHSNFFRMGGDSILAMTLISQAREAGYSIKMADIFNHPKLANLAAAAVRTNASTRSTIPPFALMSDKASKESLVELAAAQCGIDASFVEDVYPTTPLQEGLVALAAKRPGQYIVTIKYELPNDLDLDKFVTAWNATVAANAILRTRVIQSDLLGFLQVVVHESIPWQTFDDEQAYEAHMGVTRMGLGDQLVHFGLREHSNQPRKGPEFHLTLHHAIYDGGSLPLLWNQVQSAYHGELLSPQPFNHFIEHVLATEGASAFWKSEFEGLNAAIFPALPSPLYIPDPSSSLTYIMPAVEHQAADFTRTTAIRLAWAIVMSCYTDSEDIVHGLTVHGRSAPMEGIEDITGPTFATFPVRTQVRQGYTVRGALASIQEKTVATMPFQQFGMQNIRQLSRDAATACDFQCHLAVQAPMSNVSNQLINDVRTKNDDYGDFASYALVIICHLPTEAENDILVSVNYDKNIVEPLEATRMVRQFEHVLRQIELSQRNPEFESIQLRDLDLLSSEDRQQLATWNSTVPPSDDSCLHELVLHHAIHRPNAPAISAWDGEMTFKDLDSASAILSQQLQSFSVQPRSLVPLLFDRSKWAVVAMTALHRIGAACVNIDPGHPKGRIQDIIDRTEAKFILTSPTYRKTMVFEGTTLITVPIQGQQPRAEDLSPPLVSPHDIAFIIFTSGSTGKPKGILMEHANLTASIRGYTPKSYLNQNTRGLHFASYAFDASIYEIFGVLVNGGCICIPSESDRMNDVVPFIKKHNVNWAIFTPSYLSLLEPDSIPSVRTIMLGGEAITQENVDKWAAKVTLLTGYGPAEATICAASLLPKSGWKQGTLGRVTGGVGWITMPSDPSRLAPIGTPGELVIEGAVVTRGYLGDPEKTAAAYLSDPVWLRPFRKGRSGSRVYFSGDIVQYNADGTIRYLGRADNQVKLRGQRIELGEVEHHVRNAFPNVNDVVAEVARPNGGAPILIAFVANMVEPLHGATDKLFHAPSEEFLAQVGAATHKISSAVPRYMVPAIFIRLSEIPRTSSDKANRRLLREEAAKLSQDEIQAFSRSQVTRRRPKTEQEKTLQSLWAQTFKVPEDDIGADDNFLNIGDSFAAIRLASLARSQGLHLPVSQIFQCPILSEQARMVTALESTGLVGEYRPGSLLGITDIATFFDKYLSGEVSSYTAHDVEDILPTTERQDAFIRAKNVSYSRLHMSTQVDPLRLKEACRALIRKHAILRTVFVPHRDEIVQVVLRDPAFHFEERESDEDLWEYSEKLNSQDASSGVPFGTLHFQAVLISRSRSDHMFVMRMTHAQYDASSIHLISNDLTSAYNGSQLQSDAPSFAHFLRYRLSQNSSDVHGFWRDYLGGSKMTNIEMLGYMPQKNTEAEFAIKPLRKIPLPTLPGGITMASFAKAAWSVVLARATKTKDIVFGHVINGRDAPLAGVDRISYPCITMSPFRVSMQAGWTIMDLLNHTQSQYTRSMPYSNIDFKNILRNATSWSSDTDFGSVLTHQDGSVDTTGAITDAAGWKWQTENVGGIHSHFHVVTSPATDGLWVHLAVSSHKMHPNDVDHLMDQFCRVMTQFSEDASQPLPLESDEISDA
jgi:amino acid adenylation domain-containing protein